MLYLYSVIFLLSLLAGVLLAQEKTVTYKLQTQRETTRQLSKTQSVADPLNFDHFPVLQFSLTLEPFLSV